MVHKEHIENYLRINGVSTSAPDDEIRSALLAGNWREKDVDIAVLVLRGNESEIAYADVGAHTLMQTDRVITPETLSALLGIDIVLKRNQLKKTCHKNVVKRKFPMAFWFLIIGSSFIFAYVIGIYGMYIFKIGPFYSPAVEDLRF